MRTRIDTRRHPSSVYKFYRMSSFLPFKRPAPGTKRKGHLQSIFNQPLHPSNASNRIMKPLTPLLAVMSISHAATIAPWYEPTTVSVSSFAPTVKAAVSAKTDPDPIMDLESLLSGPPIRCTSSLGRDSLQPAPTGSTPSSLSTFSQTSQTVGQPRTLLSGSPRWWKKSTPTAETLTPALTRKMNQMRYRSSPSISRRVSTERRRVNARVSPRISAVPCLGCFCPSLVA